MFWRFLGFARKYRWMLLFSTLLVFISTGFTLLMPWITGMLVDNLGVFSPEEQTATVDQPGSPLHGAQAVARVISHTPHPEASQAVWLLLLALGVVSVLSIATSYWQQMNLLIIGNRVLFDVRQRLFRHLQRLSLRFYEQNSHGWIMARVLYDVDAIQATLSGNLIQIISNITLIIGAVTFLFIRSWQLALLAMVFMPLYALNFMAMRKNIRRQAAEQRDQFSQVYSILSEDVSGVKVVKSFTRERWEARRFVGEIRESMRRNIMLGRLRAILNVNAQLLTRLATLAFWAVGAYQIMVLQSDVFTVGRLIEYLGYLGLLYQPVVQLVTVTDVINTAMAAVDRIFDTLDTPPDIQEQSQPVRLRRPEGRIEFRHVGFHYEPTEPVLRDISLVAEPGQVIALVGPSGSGKTTLVHLIPRFYDPQSGQVMLDGQDLRDYSLRSLRQHIGMVMQEDFLFSGSLRDNIKYGRPEATDEEVVQAAIAANAHDFIMEFPDGYETQVGERGDRLSGGQRQRISIARALLRNPRILILDEATSDLDSESEALIQDALELLMKNRTTFTIAHRLSTVMNADQILVLDHGRIVEQGTHAELATAGGLYAKLAEVQFRRGAEKIAEHEAALAAQEGETEGG
jgi:subfamily B ATP-binding cassette protein MsbA